MTKDELVAALNALADSDDPESTHVEADRLLLVFINDPDVEIAYSRVPKWYA